MQEVKGKLLIVSCIIIIPKKPLRVPPEFRPIDELLRI